MSPPSQNLLMNRTILSRWLWGFLVEEMLFFSMRGENKLSDRCWDNSIFSSFIPTHRKRVWQNILSDDTFTRTYWLNNLSQHQFGNAIICAINGQPSDFDVFNLGLFILPGDINLINEQAGAVGRGHRHRCIKRKQLCRPQGVTIINLARFANCTHLWYEPTQSN